MPIVAVRPTVPNDICKCKWCTKVTDRTSNVHPRLERTLGIRSSHMRRRRKRNKESTACEQHQSTSVLWHPEVGHLYDTIGADIVEFQQSINECSKHTSPARQDSGDVLHKHDLRLEASHEPCHLEHQLVPWVTSFVLVRKRAKPLTRRAAGEH